METNLMVIIAAIVVVIFICWSDVVDINTVATIENNVKDGSTFKAYKKEREHDNQTRREMYSGGGHNTGFNIAYIDHMIRPQQSNTMPSFMSNPLSKYDWSNQVEGAPNPNSKFHEAHDLF